MGLSQQQMAQQMGLSLRAYADIEAGKTLRHLHLMAAQMVSLRQAVSVCDPNVAFPEVRALVEGFGAIERIRKERPRMATLTIDGSLRREFDRRWRAFTDKKAAMVRQSGMMLSIIIDPVMQGPGPDGRITYFGVDSEFLAELRDNPVG
jgi:DNA-binding XRE family transcriptional regulator